MGQQNTKQEDENKDRKREREKSTVDKETERNELEDEMSCARPRKETARKQKQNMQGLVQETPREVKREHDEQPWRHLQKTGSWDERYKSQLMKNINELKIGEKDVENIRILLIGPIKAGKSSFINTIASIDKGEISQVTLAGGEGTSMTTKLKVYRPQGYLKHFRILDTMGVEDTELGGFNIKDLVYLIKGNVPQAYQFNPASPISEESKDFVKHPKNKDKIHCVVFVMDSDVVGQDNITDASRKRIKALQDELKSQEIPRMVLLTKIDVLCEMTEADISKCYTSATVKKAVDLAKELFCVPEQNIFPLQNYTTEVDDLDPRKEILALLALRQMIKFGTNFLNEISAKTSDDEDST